MATQAITDITGARFGRLVVLHRDCVLHRKSGGTVVKWMCQCDCGTKMSVRSGCLRSGHTTSCGCLQRDRAREAQTVHGQSGTKTNWIWQSMIARCHNPNSQYFHNYGGRGIVVCERWRNSFQAFLEDMGDRPKGTTIERIDNDGNYEPSNCRWATRTEQARNMRSNRLVTYNGEIRCVAEWAEILGIGEATIRYRLNKNWPIEQVMTKPTRK